VGALVRLNNVVVLDAIVRAETEIEPLGLALIKGANALQLMCGTEIELRRHLFGPPQQQERLRRPELIEQVTTINLAARIAGVRRNAEKAGFDLGAPLFLMPGDPHYAGIRRELQEIRDQETKRLEEAITAARVALRQRITENVMIQ
jgi:CHASE3 domain sensor protein